MSKKTNNFILQKTCKEFLKNLFFLFFKDSKLEKNKRNEQNCLPNSSIGFLNDKCQIDNSHMCQTEKRESFLQSACNYNSQREF